MSLNGRKVTSVNRGSNGSRYIERPVTESDPMVSPWYDRSNATNRCLAVDFRASFNAPSLASVPLIVK